MSGWRPCLTYNISIIGGILEYFGDISFST
jgi:hypothetical protein